MSASTLGRSRRSAPAGQAAIQAGESAVEVLQAAVREAEDGIRRLERQRAVLYPEDTDARNDVTQQIGQLEGDLVGLHDELEAKETSLMDLHVAHGTAASLDWRRVVALRTLRQRHWARRKTTKRADRQAETLTVNRTLDPNYNRSLRLTARQRTCTLCFHRFVVDDNPEAGCRSHPGRFVHDDARCPCAGAIRRDRPNVDADMASYYRQQLVKNHGRFPNNLTIVVRRGQVCTFAYTCCGARDVRTPGCLIGKHNWRQR